ncbi:hypothetical protein MPH_13129, partial [Macrophomina phaseolina MS6]
MILRGLLAGILASPAAGGILWPRGQQLRPAVTVLNPDCVVEIDIGATVYEQPVVVRTSVPSPTTLTIGAGATITVTAAAAINTVVTLVSITTGTRTRTRTVRKSGFGITSTTTLHSSPGQSIPTTSYSITATLTSTVFGPSIPAASLTASGSLQPVTRNIASLSPEEGTVSASWSFVSTVSIREVSASSGIFGLLSSPTLSPLASNEATTGLISEAAVSSVIRTATYQGGTVPTTITVGLATTSEVLVLEPTTAPVLFSAISTVTYTTVYDGPMISAITILPRSAGDPATVIVQLPNTGYFSKSFSNDVSVSGSFVSISASASGFFGSGASIAYSATALGPFITQSYFGPTATTVVASQSGATYIFSLVPATVASFYGPTATSAYTAGYSGVTIETLTLLPTGTATDATLIIEIPTAPLPSILSASTSVAMTSESLIIGSASGAFISTGSMGLPSITGAPMDIMTLPYIGGSAITTVTLLSGPTSVKVILAPVPGLTTFLGATATDTFTIGYGESTTATLTILPTGTRTEATLLVETPIVTASASLNEKSTITSQSSASVNTSVPGVLTYPYITGTITTTLVLTIGSAQQQIVLVPATDISTFTGPTAGVTYTAGYDGSTATTLTVFPSGTTAEAYLVIATANPSTTFSPSYSITVSAPYISGPTVTTISTTTDSVGVTFILTPATSSFTGPVATRTWTIGYTGDAITTLTLLPTGSATEGTVIVETPFGTASLPTNLGTSTSGPSAAEPSGPEYAISSSSASQSSETRPSTSGLSSFAYVTSGPILTVPYIGGTAIITVTATYTGGSSTLVLTPATSLWSGIVDPLTTFTAGYLGTSTATLFIVPTGTQIFGTAIIETPLFTVPASTPPSLTGAPLAPLSITQPYIGGTDVVKVTLTIDDTLTTMVLFPATASFTGPVQTITALTAGYTGSTYVTVTLVPTGTETAGTVLIETPALPSTAPTSMLSILNGPISVSTPIPLSSSAPVSVLASITLPYIGGTNVLTITPTISGTTTAIVITPTITVFNGPLATTALTVGYPGSTPNIVTIVPAVSGGEGTIVIETPLPASGGLSLAGTPAAATPSAAITAGVPIPYIGGDIKTTITPVINAITTTLVLTPVHPSITADITFPVASNVITIGYPGPMKVTLTLLPTISGGEATYVVETPTAISSVAPSYRPIVSELSSGAGTASSAPALSQLYIGGNSIVTIMPTIGGAPTAIVIIPTAGATWTGPIATTITIGYSGTEASTLTLLPTGSFTAGTVVIEIPTGALSSMLSRSVSGDSSNVEYPAPTPSLTTGSANSVASIQSISSLGLTQPYIGTGTLISIITPTISGSLTTITISPLLTTFTGPLATSVLTIGHFGTATSTLTLLPTGTLTEGTLLIEMPLTTALSIAPAAPTAASSAAAFVLTQPYIGTGTNLAVITLTIAGSLMPLTITPTLAAFTGSFASSILTIGYAGTTTSTLVLLPTGSLSEGTIVIETPTVPQISSWPYPLVSSTTVPGFTQPYIGTSVGTSITTITATIRGSPTSFGITPTSTVFTGPFAVSAITIGIAGTTSALITLLPTRSLTEGTLVVETPTGAITQPYMGGLFVTTIFPTINGVPTAIVISPTTPPFFGPPATTLTIGIPGTTSALLVLLPTGTLTDVTLVVETPTGFAVSPYPSAAGSEASLSISAPFSVTSGLPLPSGGVATLPYIGGTTSTTITPTINGAPTTLVLTPAAGESLFMDFTLPLASHALTVGYPGSTISTLTILPTFSGGEVTLVIETPTAGVTAASQGSITPGPTVGYIGDSTVQTITATVDGTTSVLVITPVSASFIGPVGSSTLTVSIPGTRLNTITLLPTASGLVGTVVVQNPAGGFPGSARASVSLAPGSIISQSVSGPTAYPATASLPEGISLPYVSGTTTLTIPITLSGSTGFITLVPTTTLYIGDVDPFTTFSIGYNGSTTSILTIVPTAPGNVGTIVIETPTALSTFTPALMSSGISRSYISGTATITVPVTISGDTTVMTLIPASEAYSGPIDPLITITIGYSGISTSTLTIIPDASGQMGTYVVETPTAVASGTPAVFTGTGASTTFSSGITTAPTLNPPVATGSARPYIGDSTVATLTALIGSGDAPSVYTITPATISSYGGSVAPLHTMTVYYPGTTTKTLLLLPTGADTVATYLIELPVTGSAPFISTAPTASLSSPAYAPSTIAERQYQGDSTVATITPIVSGTGLPAVFTIRPASATFTGPIDPVTTLTAVYPGLSTKTLTLLPAAGETFGTLLIGIPAATMPNSGSSAASLSIGMATVSGSTALSSEALVTTLPVPATAASRSYLGDSTLAILTASTGFGAPLTTLTIAPTIGLMTYAIDPSTTLTAGYPSLTVKTLTLLPTGGGSLATYLIETPNTSITIALLPTATASGTYIGDITAGVITVSAGIAGAPTALMLEPYTGASFSFNTDLLVTLTAGYSGSTTKALTLLPTVSGGLGTIILETPIGISSEQPTVLSSTLATAFTLNGAGLISASSAISSILEGASETTRGSQVSSASTFLSSSSNPGGVYPGGLPLSTGYSSPGTPIQSATSFTTVTIGYSGMATTIRTAPVGADGVFTVVVETPSTGSRPSGLVTSLTTITLGYTGSIATTHTEPGGSNSVATVVIQTPAISGLPLSSRPAISPITTVTVP